MRITALAPYPERSPSTRFRLAQFRGPLAGLGIELGIRPFFTEEEYRQVYGSGGTLRKAALLARGLRRRRGHLAEARKADLVLVHRALAPVLEGGLLKELGRSGVPMAFDFDDAIFLPAQGGHRLLGSLRNPRSATAALCRAAKLVLAGNEYLASFAREAREGREGVRLLPTVIDTGRYLPPQTRPGEEGALPTVGWIGTHTTAPYLEAIYPELEAAHRETPFRFLVVSNRPPTRPRGLEMEFHPWSEEGEMEDLRSMDVGIYPLPDDPWTLGKCGFKAIQYMACGIPVVGSPVGVMKEIVLEGKTGLHVRRPGEWERALETLLADRGLRRRMGEAGRARAEGSYSIRAVLPELGRWLLAAAEAGD